MIPKKIHYCWFGRNPLPESALKCIASWKKFLPDYEIIEWDEDNFDVNSIPYTAQAYAAKKYAFVSDYARFKILYEHGGLYFDTDVEVIKPMDDIVATGPFMGIEVGLCNAKGFRKSQATIVAPGLGLGAEPKMNIYGEVIEYYDTLEFISNGIQNTKTVGEHVTSLLILRGLKHTAEIQKVDELTIYPMDWFNPFDDATGKLNITQNTVSIHWYSKTWLEPKSSWRTRISRFAHRFLGVNFTARLKNLTSIDK